MNNTLAQATMGVFSCCVIAAGLWLTLLRWRRMRCLTKEQRQALAQVRQRPHIYADTAYALGQGDDAGPMQMIGEVVEMAEALLADLNGNGESGVSA